MSTRTTRIALTTSLMLASLSQAALAQSSYEPWEGTWTTTYGEVRLIEEGDYVYGDYGAIGTIQAITNEDKSIMRGIFTRTNGDVGYIEWVQSGDDGNRFTGRWKWQANGFPEWNAQTGGTKWRGDRRNSASPRLVTYTGNTGRNAFMARQTSDFRRWAIFRYQPQLATRPTPTPSPTPTDKDPAKSWLAKVPYLRSVGTAPKWMEIKLNRIGMGLDEARTYEIYGTAGLYAYCETPTGTRALKPYYGARNRVVDRKRRDARTGPIKLGANAGVLRFAFDEACLKQNGGRLSFQLQTNLAEKDTIRRLDDDFGYRGWKFYLEDIPTEIRIFNWGNAAEGIKIYRDGSTSFKFRHMENLNGRLTGERMYFYGELNFGF